MAANDSAPDGSEPLGDGIGAPPAAEAPVAPAHGGSGPRGPDAGAPPAAPPPDAPPTCGSGRGDGEGAAARAARVLAVPHSAMVSVIFGMMALSFPLGAYVVFSPSAPGGGMVDHGYPLGGIGLFAAGLGIEVPAAGLRLGDAFAALWCAYAAVFAVSALGPCRGLYAELSSAMGHAGARAAAAGGGAGGPHPPRENYMHAAVRWFAILVLASAAIAAVQSYAGVPAAEPPSGGDEMLRFFEVAKAPLAEEIGFRVALVGVPLFLVCAGESSLRSLAHALWHPHRHLPRGPRTRRAAAALVAGTAVFFGVAHVLSGEPWGAGKLAQATASGVILGWVYYRHGLAPAILVHWAANYFVFSYAYYAALATTTTATAAFDHPILLTLEGVFVAAGAIALALIVLGRVAARRRRHGRRPCAPCPSAPGIPRRIPSAPGGRPSVAAGVAVPGAGGGMGDPPLPPGAGGMGRSGGGAAAEAAAHAQRIHRGPRTIAAGTAGTARRGAEQIHDVIAPLGNAASIPHAARPIPAGRSGTIYWGEDAPPARCPPYRCRGLSR